MKLGNHFFVQSTLSYISESQINNQKTLYRSKKTASLNVIPPVQKKTVDRFEKTKNHPQKVLFYR